jgi:hypothetical protein
LQSDCVLSVCGGVDVGIEDFVLREEGMEANSWGEND